MKSQAPSLQVNFNQVLSLVKQLSKKEKIRLSKELEREIISVKLHSLLTRLKTEELTQDTIDAEVETVRRETYARSKAR
jgi:hypothetical protein